MEINEDNHYGKDVNNDGCNSLEFPDGMRVLAVDDDSVCLAFLTALLKKCRYQVTSLMNKTEALELLKQNAENFDIILTNVYVDEMEGFKLLETGIELDIPVVMISACESKDIIKKGVRHGVVNYLIKPVRFQDVQTIWQSVYRKRLTNNHRIGKIEGDLTINESLKNEDENPMNDHNIEIQGDEGTSKSSKTGGKKKCSLGDDDNVGSGGGDHDNPTEKKERFRWTKERCNKFQEAVERLGGIDKAVPKKILELMDEPGVTREQVASHLQKFRKNRKENTICNQFPKDNNSNYNKYSFDAFLASSFIGSSMNGISGHQPIPGNTMPQGLFGPSHYHNQPNTNVWRTPPSIGYTSPSPLPLPDGTNQLNYQPQRMMPSNEGSFMSSSLNPMFQEQHQQLHRNTSIDPMRPLQLQEEVNDRGPNIVDSMHGFCRANGVYNDMDSDYHIPLSFPENGENDQVYGAY